MSAPAPASQPAAPPQSVARQLLKTAWPLIIGGQLIALDSFNTRYWLGHYLGSDAIAVHATVDPLNGQIGFLFSAADCGNDVIQGVVNTGYSGLVLGATAVESVPEPGPEVMVLTGLVLLVVGRQLRKRTKSRN